MILLIDELKVVEMIDLPILPLKPPSGGTPLWEGPVLIPLCAIDWLCCTIWGLNLNKFTGCRTERPKKKKMKMKKDFNLKHYEGVRENISITKKKAKNW